MKDESNIGCSIPILLVFGGILIFHLCTHEPETEFKRMEIKPRPKVEYKEPEPNKNIRDWSELESMPDQYVKIVTPDGKSRRVKKNLNIEDKTYIIIDGKKYRPYERIDRIELLPVK